MRIEQTAALGSDLQLAAGTLVFSYNKIGVAIARSDRATFGANHCLKIVCIQVSVQERKNSMKRLTLALIASLMFPLIMAAPRLEGATLFKSPLPPAQNFTSSAKVPIDLFVFVPCALGGVGEVAHLTGNLHELTHFTANANGGFQVESHFQPQGISGAGLTSGDKYQGTGVTRDHFNVSGLPYEQTFVNNFRMIGQGNGNNFLVHENLHVTVNSNGEMTVFVDNFRVECK